MKKAVCILVSILLTLALSGCSMGSLIPSDMFSGSFEFDDSVLTRADGKTVEPRGKIAAVAGTEPPVTQKSDDGTPDDDLPGDIMDLSKWPDSGILAQLGRPASGSVLSSVSYEGAQVVNMTEVKKADYDALVSKLKSAGFTQDMQEQDLSEYGSGYMFTASDGQNTAVLSFSDGSLTIAVTKGS